MQEFEFKVCPCCKSAGRYPVSRKDLIAQCPNESCQRHFYVGKWTDPNSVSGTVLVDPSANDSISEDDNRSIIMYADVKPKELKHPLRVYVGWPAKKKDCPWVFNIDRTLAIVFRGINEVKEFVDQNEEYFASQRGGGWSHMLYAEDFDTQLIIGRVRTP